MSRTAELVNAVRQNNAELVTLLITAGCDINQATTGDGHTPLWEASYRGRDKIADLLITAGCNINQATTGDGCTPLYIASSRGHDEIADLLITAGCNINQATTGTGHTPLWAASSRGHDKIANLLITAGCDVNQAKTGSSPTTPLQVASDRGNFEIVDSLITANSDVNIESIDAVNILNFAVEQNRLYLIYYMVDNELDIKKKYGRGKSCLTVALDIQDVTKRLSVLAALHRRPPDPKLMSEDDWYITSINDGRDILRLMRDENLYDPSQEFTFRQMKNVGKPKTQSQTRDMQRAYPMCSRPRGRAIIMNLMNYQHEPKKKRNGSEVDVKRLHLLFTQLGFDVELWEDCTNDEFEKRIESEMKHELHKKANAFIFAAMGHGTDGGGLLLSDNTLIDLSNDLVSKFDGENCPDLRGRPKVFLFQACRGKSEGWPVEAAEAIDVQEQVDGADDYRYCRAESNKVHKKADILKIYSTYEGFSAVRHSGSWFIEELVFVCEMFAHEMHILDLITEANRLLRHRESYVTGYVQTAQLDSSLRKPLFFFPGYFSEDWDKDEKKKCVVS